MPLQPLATMPISQARFKIREAVDKVRYQNKPVEITVNNKGVAVIIDKQLFNLIQKLTNPSDQMSAKQWETGFAIYDQISQSLSQVPYKKWENTVQQAVKDIREQ